MSASNGMEGALLNLIFQNANTAIGIGLNGSSVGSMYISLHTGDPTESGNQTSSEANYTGYSRVAVSRSGSGWTFNSASGSPYVGNATAITFPTCTGGSSNITYFGIGSDSTGTGNLWFSGNTTSFLNISNNITPAYQANTLLIYVD